MLEKRKALLVCLMLVMTAFTVVFLNVSADTINVNPGESIQEAIDAANPGDTIFVEAGTYYENLVVDKSINLIGANRDTTIINGGGSSNGVYVSADLVNISGFRILNCEVGIWISSSIDIDLYNLRISSNNNYSPGGSSYDLFSTDSLDISINNCIVDSGQGADGSNGLPGTAGINGNNGQQGQPGCEDSSGFCSSCSQPHGGSGGASAYGRYGGMGGNAGRSDNSGSNGGAGAGSGGGMGGGGTPSEQGNWNTPSVYCGQNGVNGENGLDGSGGNSIGSMSSDGYIPSEGAQGTDGSHGYGGGGGGGGGGGTTSCDSYGGGGGGGGSGGASGSKGFGGTGGGGSFGICFYNCYGVSVKDSDISTNQGGDGGAGGNGGAGGIGGNGGWGGDPSRPNAGNPYGGGSDQDDGSNGGKGGNGGVGGTGGNGGGGGGGPSIGIISYSSSFDEVEGNVFNIASSGYGGTSSGNEGLTGLNTDIYELEGAQIAAFVDDDFNSGTPGWQVTHFDSIQDGIDAVGTDCFVFVNNGIYYENVNINKDGLKLIGEDKDNTIIDGSGADVVSISEDYVKIIGFTIKNGLCGIRLYISSSGLIKDNIIKDSDYGIFIETGSYDNTIYHNNILDNTQNANDLGTNAWDYGHLYGGNYWSDYSGVDANHDGIGDTPYDIPGGDNQDLYPFIEPSGWQIPANQMPIADFTYVPLNPSVFEPITFTDASIDSDGVIVTWSWDFDDGDTSFEQNTIHQYAQKGTYTVTLTVTDDDGATDVEVKLVTVQNIAPTADFTYTPTNPTDTTVIHFTDISNDPDGTIVSWYWDFGDDYYASKESPTHCYYEIGIYSVTLTVTDDDGAQNTIQKTITVSTPTNNPPHTPSKPSGLIIGVTKIIYTYTTSTTDIDGDLLYYKWNWGDGTTSDWLGPYGSDVLAAAMHKWTNAGTYSLKVKVKDINGAESAWSPALTVWILKL